MGETFHSGFHSAVGVGCKPSSPSATASSWMEASVSQGWLELDERSTTLHGDDPSSSEESEELLALNGRGEVMCMESCKIWPRIIEHENGKANTCYLVEVA